MTAPAGAVRLPLAAPAYLPLTVAPQDVGALLDDPLAQVTAVAPVLVLSVDHVGVVRFAAGRLWGAVFTAAVGQPLAAVDQLVPDLAQLVRESLTAGLVRRVDVHIGARVVDVVAQPVLTGPGDTVGGVVLFGADITEARRVQRRSQVLTQLADDSVQAGEPAEVMNVVAAAVSQYTGAPVVVRISDGPTLVRRAVAAPDPSLQEALEAAVAAAGPVRTAQLHPLMGDASGAVTLTWEQWVDALQLPDAVQGRLRELGARQVVTWPLRSGGQLRGLLIVVAMAEPGVDVVGDLDEQLFLGEVAARAGLHLETAQLRVDGTRAAAALRASESRFRSAFWAAPVGMVLARADGDQLGVIEQVNEAYVRLLGMRASDVVGRRVQDLVHVDDRGQVHELLEQVAGGPVGGQGVREHQVVTRSGDVVWVRMSVALADEGRTGQLIGHVEDVTTARLAADELARRAWHDPLTSLPNRYLALDHLQLALSALRRRPGSVAVLFTDLDEFKEVNDTYGHDVGDRVLAQVAGRLRGAVRDQDTPARLGGDEFVVVCPDVGSTGQLHLLLTRLSERLREPVLLEVGSALVRVDVGASIGASVTSSAQTAGERMLREADMAMYVAKRAGHPFHVYGQ